MGCNLCKCFQTKPIVENKFFVLTYLDFLISELCDGLRKKCKEEHVCFLHGLVMLMMMTCASISQFCSLNNCPFVNYTDRFMSHCYLLVW